MARNQQQESLDYIDTYHRELNDNFETDFTKGYDFRYHQLEQILKFIEDTHDICVEALKKDLNKHVLEAETSEINIVKNSLHHKMKSLKSFVQPKQVLASAVSIPAHSYVQYEPLGTVLCIGPFNFPYQLMLMPLIDAIAAGNCVLLKPSEMTENIAKVVTELLPKYLDPRVLRIVNGSIPEVTKLLSLKWDFIFFTGSTMVGRIVNQAAAKFLTPVCLELGGKSPVYVDESVADMALAARRICWGKFSNAGQACIAPDYILCHKSRYDELLECLKTEILAFYEGKPKESESLGRIVNERHCLRLKKMLESKSGEVYIGGDCDMSQKYIEPTVLKNVKLDSVVMEEEIFGPILPTIPVENVDEAIKVIKSIPGKPLALYPFGRNQDVHNKLISKVQSGGVTINDTLIHFSNHNLPFGGVGDSGIGSYHGDFSFETFSHKRGICSRWDHWIGDVVVRYPPYTDNKRRVFNFLLSTLGGINVDSQILLPLTFVGIALSAVLLGAIVHIDKAIPAIDEVTNAYVVPGVLKCTEFFKTFLLYASSKLVN